MKIARIIPPWQIIPAHINESTLLGENFNTSLHVVINYCYYVSFSFQCTPRVHHKQYWRNRYRNSLTIELYREQPRELKKFWPPFYQERSVRSFQRRVWKRSWDEGAILPKVRRELIKVDRYYREAWRSSEGEKSSHIVNKFEVSRLSHSMKYHISINTISINKCSKIRPSLWKKYFVSDHPYPC